MWPVGWLTLKIAVPLASLTIGTACCQSPQMAELPLKSVTPIDQHCAAAELQSLSGVKPAEVCSKAMAVCGVVARYGAAPLADGNPATVDAYLARLIRQALQCALPAKHCNYLLPLHPLLPLCVLLAARQGSLVYHPPHQ